MLSGTAPSQAPVEPTSASVPEVIAAAVGDEVVFQDQTQYDNFFSPNVIAFDFPIDPVAVGGRIDITALSDLDSVSESVAYDIEGVVSGDLFTGPDDGLRPFTATINLSDTDLAALAADGNLHIELTPNSNVDDFGNVDEFVTVGLTYEIPGTPILLSPLGETLNSVFTGSADGVFTSPNQTDYYSLDLQADQLVRFEGVPDAGVTIGFELRDPSGAVIFSETAASSQPLLMQAVRAPMDGRYTLGVMGGAFTGSYSLRADVNRAVEDESVGRTSTGGTVQNMDLNPYFTSLSGDVEQVTLLGTNGYYDPGGGSSEYLESFETGSLGAEWEIDPAFLGRIRITDDYSTPNGQYALVMDSSHGYGANEAILTLNLADVIDASLYYKIRYGTEAWNPLPDTYTGHQLADGVSMSADGVTWHRIYSDSSSYYNDWYSYSLDLFAAAQDAGIELGSDFKIKFQQYNETTTVGSGLGFDQIYVDSTRYRALPSHGPDHFQFTLDQGQHATVRLKDLDSDTQEVGFDIYPGSGLNEIAREPGISIFQDLGSSDTRTFSVWLDPAGPYHLTITRGGTSQPLDNLTDQDAHPLGRTGRVVGGIENTGEQRYFSFPVIAGDELSISTITPYDGAAGLNTLDPVIELFDPTGASVAFDDNSGADGRNALITHTATQTGTYLIRVVDAGATTGAFLLETLGGTGVVEPVFDIHEDYFHFAQLTRNEPYRVNILFNEPVLKYTVQASDLTINGVPAESVIARSNEYYEFTLDTDASVEGLNTMAFAAGSVYSYHGDPLPYREAFFTLDTISPIVTGSSVLNGELLTSGDVTIDLEFSEPVRNLHENDISLAGALAGLVTPDSFSLNETNDGLSVSFSGLAEDYYTFKLLDNNSYPYIEDLAGNRLDGEAHPLTTVPSGDGSWGGDFTVNFGVEDNTPKPLNLQWAPIEPLGSLVYESDFSGVLEIDGDLDHLTFDLAAGDRLSLLVQTPGYSPAEASVELLDPSGTAVVAAAVPNSEINLFNALTSGTYTLVVSNTGTGRSEYTGKMLLNAYIELDPANRINNPTFAQATNLAPAFHSLGGSVQQAVVIDYTNPIDVGGNLGESFELGELNEQWSPQSDYWHFRIADTSDAVDGERVLVLWYNSSIAELSETVWTVNLTEVVDPILNFAFAESENYPHPLPQSFTGSVLGDGVSISNDGVNWWTILDAPQTEEGGWEWFSVNLASAADDAGISLGSELMVKFQFYGHRSVVGYSYDAIHISSGQKDAYYRVALDAGESLTATMYNDDPDASSLELLDASGQLLTFGDPDWADADEKIAGFIAPAAGDYYLRVVNRVPGFKLVLTKDADFNPEPEPGHADPVLIQSTAVGAIGPSITDYDTYRFYARAGDQLDLWTELPGFGPTAPANTLNPQLELALPDGFTLYDQDSGADGINARIVHTAAVDGWYSLLVYDEGDTTGAYMVHVDSSGELLTDMFVTEASAEDGESLNTVPAQYELWFTHPVLLDTIQPEDLTINGIPALAVSVPSPNKLVFDLPALSDGIHDFQIAGGAVTGITGRPVDEFNAAITIDTTPPRIIASSVYEASTVETGDLSVVVRFDEPIRADVVPASQARVRYLIDNKIVLADSVSYNPATNELTFGFGALEEGSYRLDILSNSYLADLAGNQLDGEAPAGPIPPNTSGDGTPGGNFSVNFQMDRTAASAALTFQSFPRYGSTASASLYQIGKISTDTDVDTFKVFMHSGQTLSARLRVVAPLRLSPSQTPTPSSLLALSAPGQTVFADDPNEALAITYTHTGPNGFVDLTVANHQFSQDTEFSLDVYLDAVLEKALPTLTVGADQAIDLNAAFVDLPDGNQSAIATVIGTGKVAPTSTTFGNIRYRYISDFVFSNMPAPSGDGTLNVYASTELGSYPGSGAYFFSETSSLGISGPGDLTPIVLPQADLAAWASDGEILFQADTTPWSSDLGYHELTLELSYPGLTFDPDDTYALNLEAGQSISVLLDSDRSDFELDIIDAATGTVLAQPLAGNGLDANLDGWLVPATGTYLIRVHANGYGTYQMQVIRNAVLHSDLAVASQSTPTALDSTDAALGHLRTAAPGRLFALIGATDYTGLSTEIRELDPLTFDAINSLTPGGFPDVIPRGVNSLAYTGGILYGATVIVDGIPPQPGRIHALDPDTGVILSWFDADQLGMDIIYKMASYGDQLVFLSGSELVFADPLSASAIRTVTHSAPTSPEAIAGAPDRGSVFIMDYSYSNGANEVYEIDAHTGQLIQTLTPSFPFGSSDASLAYLNGQLILTDNRWGGTYFMDPDSGGLIRQVSTTFNYLSALGTTHDAASGHRDAYTLNLMPGQQISLATATLFDDPQASLANTLDPALRVFDPNGTEIAFDDNGGADGKNAALTFTAVAGGSYTIEVQAVSGTGDYLLDINRAPFLVGDLNGDGFVGIDDLNTVLGKWNQSVPVGDLAQGDVSGDGFVGIDDLNAVLGNWNASLPAPVIPGDLNDDGFVGIDDLNLVLAHWNTDGSADTRSDPTSDGYVGIDDLNLVLGHWNNGLPPSSGDLSLMIQQAAMRVPVATALGDNEQLENQSEANAVFAAVEDVSEPIQSRPGRRHAQPKAHIPAATNHTHRLDPSADTSTQPALAALNWHRTPERQTMLSQGYTPWSLRSDSSESTLGLWEDTDRIPL